MMDHGWVFWPNPRGRVPLRSRSGRDVFVDSADSPVGLRFTESHLPLLVTSHLAQYRHCRPRTSSTAATRRLIYIY